MVEFIKVDKLEKIKMVGRMDEREIIYLDELAKSRGYKDFDNYKDEYVKFKGYKSYDDYIIDLNKRRVNNEITKTEYYNELYRSRGYENRTDYFDKWAKIKGYSNYRDYELSLVKKRGYENWNEYSRDLAYRCGRYLPMSENRDCSYYLGIYIAQDVLSKIFEDVQNMPMGTKGYDFVCKNGYKIDVKSACLSHKNTWIFHIKYNKTADYFLLIAFDNRSNLNPMHVWKIGGNEVITSYRYGDKREILNQKNNLEIVNSVKSSEHYKKYEITDKLDKVKEMCEIFKKEHNIQKKEELPKLKIIFPRKPCS